MNVKKLSFCPAQQLAEFYFGGLRPVGFVTATLLWWPLIATKVFFIFNFLHFTPVTTCFGPCGPSSGEYYRFLDSIVVRSRTPVTYLRIK
jgi:hypothetical protein